MTVRRILISILLYSNLHLTHDSVVGIVSEHLCHTTRNGLVLERCALVNILQLDAATLVEPVLETEDGLVLIHVLLHVVVEEIVRANQVDLRCNGQNACCIDTTAGHILVATFQLLRTKAEARGLRLVGETC